MSNNYIQIYNGGLYSADPFWSKVVLLMHMDEGAFTDQRGHTVTNVGGVTLDTTNKKFGSASAGITNNGTWLEITNTADLFLGSNDFTIEGFVKITSFMSQGGVLLGRWGIGPATATDWLVHMTGSQIGFNGLGSYYANAGTMADNAWHHVTVERYGSTLYIYKDGQIIGSTAVSGSVSNNGGRNLRTTRWDDGGSGFLGNIDELRITNGAARYKGQNFSIPTAAYPNQ